MRLWAVIINEKHEGGPVTGRESKFSSANLLSGIGLVLVGDHVGKRRVRRGREGFLRVLRKR